MGHTQTGRYSMRILLKPVLALALLGAAPLAAIAPAQALTITARVAADRVAIRDLPSDDARIVGRLAKGEEVPVDECRKVQGEEYSDERDAAGNRLYPREWYDWCRIPDVGWVPQGDLLGKGLVNVTQPDFTNFDRWR
jgi:hypothetical protein